MDLVYDRAPLLSTLDLFLNLFVFIAFQIVLFLDKGVSVFNSFNCVLA